MLVIGLSHTQGNFTAVTQSGSSFTSLTAHALGARRDLSYEHYFSSSGMPRFMLDLRVPNLVSGDGGWLAGPRESRAIGCCYDPGRPSTYWSSERLSDLYDVLIHIETTRATTLLPSTLPTDFSGN
jgi:erythromycin esterase-like protein